MQTRPLIEIFDVATGESLVRAMNDIEFAQYNKDQITEKQQKAEAEARVEAKATAEAKLAALGLSADDLKALGL